MNKIKSNKSENEPWQVNFAESSPFELIVACDVLNEIISIGASVLNYNKKIKIAILSSTTNNFLLEYIRLYFFQKGIFAEFYDAPFNNIISEILDVRSSLYSFKPDFTLILPYINDIDEYPDLFADNQQVDNLINNYTQKYIGLINKIKQKVSSYIIFSLFVLPNQRQLGNLEAKYKFSRITMLRQLNLKLAEDMPNDVTVLDLDYLFSNIGKDACFDEVGFFTSKFAYSLSATKEMTLLIGNLISSALGDMKKCLILDLDNTLWGGIIGDDGLNGINLDVNNPLGEAFLAFQRYLLQLRQRGILLAVCSKNDLNNALLPFKEHPNMLLKESDISCFMCNWDDKPLNIKRIAEYLNLSADSFVYFDDNPAEREIVRTFLPEVKVINVPDDPALFVRALDKSYCFEWLQLSPEDISRTDFYVKKGETGTAIETFVNYEDYLKSLEMYGKVSHLSKNELPRFTQLINKTNQFNLRTVRYSESQIMEMMQEQEKNILLFIELNDKFTPFGIISSLILKIDGNSLFIDTWVMSCRAFKRGVEKLAFNSIIENAKKIKAEQIIGEYIPTNKNHIVADLFTDFNFIPDAGEKHNKSSGQSSFFYLKTEDAGSLLHYIQMR
ncbi:MAG: hypothetical protein QG635_2396 [Bacteroidota bacterium]|nr:hypothetical protein [Bacteroidota bacterium]